MRIRRKFSGASAVLARMLLLTASCGGGGDVDLYPLWVATDVIVADIDGDGFADLVIFGGDTPPLWMRQSATAPGSLAAPALLP